MFVLFDDCKWFFVLFYFHSCWSGLCFEYFLFEVFVVFSELVQKIKQFPQWQTATPKVTGSHHIIPSKEHYQSGTIGIGWTYPFKTERTRKFRILSIMTNVTANAFMVHCIHCTSSNGSQSWSGHILDGQTKPSDTKQAATPNPAFISLKLQKYASFHRLQHFSHQLAEPQNIECGENLKNG